MARTAKTPRYNEFNEAVNGFGPHAQNPAEWRTYLDGRRPLYLELGCGRAEVTLGLARTYPERNFIGVDLKADRLWRPSKTSLEEGLKNTAFIQSNILEIGDFFKPGEVDGIWITFPDPFPKDRQAKHRMLNANFLELYKKLLSSNGVVQLKTDNDDYFEWAIGELTNNSSIQIDRVERDLHSSDVSDDAKHITTYESKFLAEGITTKYCQFRFAESDSLPNHQ